MNFRNNDKVINNLFEFNKKNLKGYLPTACFTLEAQVSAAFF